jgi:hypothetical protein
MHYRGICKLHRQLRRRIAERTITAAEESLSGADVSEYLKQLDAYGKVMSALPHSKLKDLYRALITAIVCLLVSGTALAVRVQTTKVHLRVKTTAVSMRLAAPLAWEGKWQFGGSVFSLEKFT